mmetsp:Transcript_50657/g.109902  ORF Transcript_50657/g.109902 Transcript_50657/m.109902 type:complete len:364 (+) Transcript_50657:1474-2565(+)
MLVLKLLLGVLDLRLLRFVNHRHDRRDVRPNLSELRGHVGAGVAAEAEQVGRDLVLHEESEQLLRQLDLLGKRVARQPEQRLELRLDLDDQDGEERALELHRAVGLGEALLLGRERLDRVAKRLGRRELLEAEWDAQLVLVLEDDGVLGLEGGVRANGAEQKHEARELARARREGEGVARLAFERVRQVRVQVALARKEHARRRRQTEAHRRRRRGGAADERMDGHRGLGRLSRLRFDGDGAFRVMIRAPNREAEGLRLVGGAEKLLVVVLHVLGKIARRELAPDGCDELFPEHLLDAVDAVVQLLQNLLQVCGEDDERGLGGGNEAGRRRRREGGGDGGDAAVERRALQPQKVLDIAEAKHG